MIYTRNRRRISFTLWIEKQKVNTWMSSKLYFLQAGNIYLTSNEMARFYIVKLNNGNYIGLSVLNPTSIAE